VTLGVLLLLGLPVGVVWWGRTQQPQDMAPGKQEQAAAGKAPEVPPVEKDKPAPQGGAVVPKDKPEAKREQVPPKPPPAALHLQLDAAVRLQAGESKTVDVRIGRDHCPGPVELRVEGLPPGVTARRDVVPADKNEGHVELTAAANVDLADEVVVRLEALATDARTQGTSRLSVVPRPPPPRPPVAALHLLAIEAVRLEAGQSKTVTLRIQRENCKGPVELRVAGLPPGITARPGFVPANAEEGQVELTAAAEARGADGRVRLVAVAAEVRTEREFPLTIVPRPAEPAKEILNSIGMPLLLIPAGKFKMGSRDSDKDASDDEKPQHDVEITRPFYLGKHEVTRGQFRKFIEATGHQTEAEKDGQGGSGFNKETKKFEGRRQEYTWRNAGYDQTDEHPVGNVTWNDAKAFCDWLSQKEGKKYRLPTEAEWEYSCRATTTTRYHSGDDKETLIGVANVGDAAAKEMFPGPVGRFKPNAFGLLDMHGNVSEWCEDWFDANYYKHSPVKDPEGPGAGSLRVIRGGSRYTAPQYCRAAYRYRGGPANRSCNFGFRVVRVQ
jgi:formylglycine-generating enzyme required for sulfatase activity